MKKAIVIGINGQDGSYITEWLVNNSYQVLGWVRPTRLNSIHNIFPITEKLNIIELDMTDSSKIEACLEDFQPDEIYNLASPSRPFESWEYAITIGDITAIGVTRILEAILKINPKIRYYQASTSEMFGSPCESPQNEKTPFAPRNPYGVAKLYAHWMVQNYRYYHSLYAVSGILFNHESPRRGFDFVTRKISKTAAQIKLGMADELRLGDLDARRDWGYAPEYVQSMWMMLQQEKPDVYVIGTGETHTVREFCQHAFEYLDLDYREYVIRDEHLVRPMEKVQLVANTSKAKKTLGWEAKTLFKDIVEIMVSADLDQLSNGSVKLVSNYKMPMNGKNN
ncbi:MAG: GDP-mannose 4,6-dehydratase [Chloroflexi bacterium HGW-Chloroflexi-8]|nr:MAG: GDP-mannose 4,6-dehydratase [Chloroflexi bacterium HGW-Chloroflexi-8]